VELVWSSMGVAFVLQLLMKSDGWKTAEKLGHIEGVAFIETAERGRESGLFQLVLCYVFGERGPARSA